MSTFIFIYSRNILLIKLKFKNVSTENLNDATDGNYPYYTNITVAPLAWVPWVPGNPSIFERND